MAPAPLKAVACLGVGPNTGGGLHHSNDLNVIRAALEMRAGELARFLGRPVEAGRALDAIRAHVGGDESAAIAWARREFLGGADG